MLTSNELESLLSCLKETKGSFHDIAQSFYKRFPKNEQFRAGCAICMLLQDKLLSLPQRLIGYYLLYDIYRSETQQISPYVPVVLDAIQSTDDGRERRFLLHFLSSLPKDVSLPFLFRNYKTNRKCL